MFIFCAPPKEHCAPPPKKPILKKILFSFKCIVKNLISFRHRLITLESKYVCAVRQKNCRISFEYEVLKRIKTRLLMASPPPSLSSTFFIPPRTLFARSTKTIFRVLIGLKKIKIFLLMSKIIFSDYQIFFQDFTCC